jgi:hypothetical protein
MNKPVMGLKPKFVHDTQRAAEITEAIKRYEAANYQVPAGWRDELADLSCPESAGQPRTVHKWNNLSNPFYHNYVFGDTDVTRQTIKWWQYPYLWLSPLLTQISGDHCFIYLK